MPRRACHRCPTRQSSVICPATPLRTSPGAWSLSRLLAGYARIGRAWLVLFDVTALYFETDKADGFREPGLSKERRLEPQIPVGLLTDETGFPLRAGAFEGNKAETATMIPMINDFMNAYNLDDVVVVADAGMISAANKQALEKAGLSYVLGSRTPARPSRDQLLARQPPRPGRPRRADPDPALARRSQ